MTPAQAEAFDKLAKPQELLAIVEYTFRPSNIMYCMLGTYCMPGQIGDFSQYLRFLDIEPLYRKPTSWYRRIDPLWPIHSFVAKGFLPLQWQSQTSLARMVDNMITTQLLQPLFAAYKTRFGGTNGAFLSDKGAGSTADEWTARFKDPHFEMWQAIVSACQIDDVLTAEDGTPTQVQVTVVMDVYSTYSLRSGERFFMPKDTLVCKIPLGKPYVEPWLRPNPATTAETDAPPVTPAAVPAPAPAADLANLIAQLEQNPDMKEQLKLLFMAEVEANGRPLESYVPAASEHPVWDEQMVDSFLAAIPKFQ